MLTRLGYVIVRRRWTVLAVWLFLTAFGVFAASQAANRWYTATAIPGRPAYEASQRSLHELGVGDRTPSVVVFHTAGDVTTSAAVEQGMQRAAGPCRARSPARTSRPVTWCTCRGTGTPRLR